MEQKECVIPVHRPDTGELAFFFACGVITSVPIALVVSALVDPLLVGLQENVALVISIAILPPFAEEFSKIFPLYYRHGETQRSIMQLALAVGFGFGLVEMITYGAVYGFQILPVRVPGLLFHPSSAAIAAYGIATKKPLPYYGLAVVLHFANNFLAIFDLPLSPSVLVVAVTVWIAWRFYKKTKETFIT